jgi:transcriptional regulator with XRE-family HTH domain
MNVTTKVTVLSAKENCKCRDFGETVKVLRESDRLSVQQLANRASLSVAVIEALEQGKVAPDTDTKTKLEQVFGCPLYFGTHRQVQVRVGECNAKIDKGIAPLIKEMWLAGIETAMSCQQDEGRVWIRFPRVRGAKKFLKIVAGHENAELYTRMTRKRTDERRLWKYEADVCDFAMTYYIDKFREIAYNPPADFDFSVTVHFPPQDLPIVLERLKEHNRKRASEAAVSKAS